MALLLCLVPSLTLAHAGLEADVARLTRALELTPTADLFLRRADKLRQLGRIEDALADVAVAEKRGAQPVLVHEARGLCFADRGEAKRALAELDVVAASPDASVPALRARARMLEQVDRGDEAVLDLARASALVPDPDVVLDQARLEEKLGRPADAARTLEVGLARLGGAATVRLALIALYRRTGQLASALRHARAGAEHLPVKIQWQLLAAEILLDQGQQREARAELTQALTALDAALASRPNGLQAQARTRALALLDQTRRRRSTPKEKRP